MEPAMTKQPRIPDPETSKCLLARFAENSLGNAKIEE